MFFSYKVVLQLAKLFGYGGILNDSFIANLLLNVPVKELWKSVNTGSLLSVKMAFA